MEMQLVGELPLDRSPPNQSAKTIKNVAEHHSTPAYRGEE
jgi:hypothetical protein